MQTISHLACWPNSIYSIVVTICFVCLFKAKAISKQLHVSTGKTDLYRSY